MKHDRSRLNSPNRAWVALVVAVSVHQATAQPATQTGESQLADRLTALLADGQIIPAIELAQQAVAESPDSAEVRRTFVDLHLTLAVGWLKQGEVAAARAALAAVETVDPENADAKRLRTLAERLAAPDEVGNELTELLKLELFDAALDRIRIARSANPETAALLKPEAATAWRGAADDHFLVGNFPEAFALYEQYLTLQPNAPAAIHSRWAVSLGLALAEDRSASAGDPHAAGRLLARAIDVLRQTEEPIIGQLIGGLLAERSGELLEAGQAYARAAGEAWALPPVDQRRGRIAALRTAAIEAGRRRYETMRTGRRDGPWQIALPNTWKQRRTAHFRVYARNDFVAERVAQAAEYHLVGLAEWLGVDLGEQWDPPAELRIHRDLNALQQATGTEGATRAVSHTRLQGGQVLSQQVEFFQTDPLLLHSTLPHELSHLLITAQVPTGRLPLTLDEGLALQAEPPARRLLFRRITPTSGPDFDTLLRVKALPADVDRFYALSDAATQLLLRRLSVLHPGRRSAQVGRLLEIFADGVPARWWTRFGWDGLNAAERDWRSWMALRGQTPRMPLMIQTEPAAEHRKQPNRPDDEAELQSGLKPGYRR